MVGVVHTGRGLRASPRGALVVLVIAVSLAATAAHARDIARDLPVEITADQITYEVEREIYVAEGDVRVVQGELKIEADWVVFNRQTRRGIAAGAELRKMVAPRARREPPKCRGAHVPLALPSQSRPVRAGRRRRGGQRRAQCLSIIVRKQMVPDGPRILQRSADLHVDLAATR